MITNNLLLRTGAGYVQKNSSSKAIGFNAEIEVSYIEVPVTIFFKGFGDVALIGGVNVDLKVGEECGGGSCSSLDIEDYVMNMVAGASFRTKGGEQVETLLEMNGLTDIANGISMGTSLTVRYVYMF